MKFVEIVRKNKTIAIVASFVLLLILIGISVTIFNVMTRDQFLIEWSDFDFEPNIEDILYLEISTENPEDIAHSNIAYFPGHYFLRVSYAGRRSFQQIQVRIGERSRTHVIPEYDRLILMVYDIMTMERVSEFDVLEMWASFGDIVEDYGLGEAIDSRVRIGDDLYVHVMVEERFEGNRNLVGERSKALLINIETGEYRLSEWSSENSWINNTQEFYAQISFFGSIGRWMYPSQPPIGHPHRSFLKNNGIYNEDGGDFLVTTFHLQPDTARVVISSKNLPEESERLYTLFPGLQQFRNQDDLRITILLTGNHWTAEEILSLFMEDGQEISFEGVIMDGAHSIDGEEHKIHSFEDYFRLRYFSEWDEE